MRRAGAAMSDLAQHAGQVLALVRERKPRVHCITNTVVQGLPRTCCWRCHSR
jgi:hypothetical protein